MDDERSWKQSWNEIANLIQESLPGEGAWMRTVPMEDGESGEGLAIRKAEDGSWLVVYFNLLAAAVGPDGTMIGAERAEDWYVEIGYSAELDTLAEAKAEAMALLEDLPEPEFEGAESSKKLSRVMINAVDERDFEEGL